MCCMTLFAPGGSLRLQQGIWQRRCIQRCTRTFHWRGGAVHERGLAGWRSAAVSPMFGFSLESTKNFGPLNLQQGRGRVGSPGKLLSFQGYHHLFIHFRLQWRPLFQHCRCVPEPLFSAGHVSVFLFWVDSGLHVFSSPLQRSILSCRLPLTLSM